jgi:hypothetical protein
VAGNRADETATKLHTPGLAGGLVLMQAEDVHGLSESQRHWVAPVLYPRTEMPVLAQARLHPMLCSHAKKAPAA